MHTLLAVLRFLHNDSIASNMTAGALGLGFGAVTKRLWLPLVGKHLAQHMAPHLGTGDKSGQDQA